MIISEHLKKDSPREWGISGQYNYNNRKTKYITSQFDELSALEYKELGPNSGINAEATIATDYLHPITSKINVELGAKSIWRDVKSDIYYDTLQISNDIYQRDQSRSNLLFIIKMLQRLILKLLFRSRRKFKQEPASGMKIPLSVATKIMKANSNEIILPGYLQV
ncbi:MAG: outer membrane beta-barrel protein [Saprospiraceae bacterium]|nr:outer membrane beta-barrel protein [Saprospiraceae bacterium]